MNILILNGYRGPITYEQYWPAGEREVDESVGRYLIDNHHARLIEETQADKYPPGLTFGAGDPRALPPLVTASGGAVIVPTDATPEDGDRDTADSDATDSDATDSEDAPPEDTDDDVTPAARPLTDMTRPELLALAEAHNVPVSGRAKTQHIIDALRAAKIE